MGFYPKTYKTDVNFEGDVKIDGSSLEAELKAVDGITAAAADINKLSGVTAGTATASKAAILGTKKELNEFHTAKLYLGTAAGTEVTATADEINILDGVTATTAELNIMDGVTATAAELNKLAGTSANVTQANLDALTGAGETALHSHAVPATVVQNKRQRVAIGDINTGATILPAIEGKAYRIIDIALVAYGGNLAATAEATGVAVSGTQSAAGAALFTVPVASLTQSTLIHSSCAGSSAFILADGASFVANDANTAVTVQAVGGSDLITATGIDVIISYVIE